MKYTDVKIMPITNPNYVVKETPEELINLLMHQNVLVIDENQNILGYVLHDDIMYVKDGFIYGSVSINHFAYAIKFTQSSWTNVEVQLNKDGFIKRILYVITGREMK